LDAHLSFRSESLLRDPRPCSVLGRARRGSLLQWFPPLLRRESLRLSSSPPWHSPSRLLLAPHDVGDARCGEPCTSCPPQDEDTQELHAGPAALCWTDGHGHTLRPPLSADGGRSLLGPRRPGNLPPPVLSRSLQRPGSLSRAAVPLGGTLGDARGGWGRTWAASHSPCGRNGGSADPGSWPRLGRGRWLGSAAAGPCDASRLGGSAQASQGAPSSRACPCCDLRFLGRRRCTWHGLPRDWMCSRNACPGCSMRPSWAFRLRAQSPVACRFAGAHAEPVELAALWWHAEQRVHHGAHCLASSWAQGGAGMGVAGQAGCVLPSSFCFSL